MRRSMTHALLISLFAISAFAQSPTKAVVDKYCVSCHSQRLKSGGLVLEGLDPSRAAASAETWEKVIVKLRSRAMPPVGAPRPDSATYDAAAGWLENEIDRAAAVRPNPGRTASLHRLNRAEYQNSIRDLLAIEINANELLPPDEQAYGFENNADALAMQPALLERYVSAATTISRLAVGDPNIPPAFVRYGAMKNNANDLTYLRQTERLAEEFPLGSKGGVAAKHYFPVDGDYVFQLRLQRAWESSIRGLNVRNQFEVRVDGVRVAQFTLGGEQNRSKTFQYDGDEALKATVPIRAGLHQVIATMLKSDNSVPEGGGADRLSSYSRNSDNATSPVAIASLHIGGPYNGKVPEHSPSRDALYLCTPSSSQEELPCATKIVTTIARRAYRQIGRAHV